MIECERCTKNTNNNALFSKKDTSLAIDGNHGEPEHIRTVFLPVAYLERKQVVGRSVEPECNATSITPSI